MFIIIIVQITSQDSVTLEGGMLDMDGKEYSGQTRGALRSSTIFWGEEGLTKGKCSLGEIPLHPDM